MTEKSRLTLKKKVEDISISERLHKVLAASGVASRRSVEDRIARGDVQINGAVAEVGAQVHAGDRLQIDGKQLLVKAVPGSYGRILIYNKPDGEVTSRNDPEGRPTVFEKLPRMRGARWISIGRLDINTQGLLIFTSNGELAHKLSHPTQGFRREYVCRIHGEASEEALQQLRSGVELEDGKACFDVLEPMDSAGGSNEWYRVEISEGRNREVRRLWEAVGLTVSRLKRTRFGPFSLPKGLNRGELAELSDEDVQNVCQEVGLPTPQPTLTTEDQATRTLRRNRKNTEIVIAPGKKLKAERAYLGYLGGHITGEERPQRGERRSADDRFDPRAKRRGPGGKHARPQGVAPGRGKAQRGRGKDAQPLMALPGYEAPTTFTYDPMTGEFGTAKPNQRRGAAGKAPRTRGDRNKAVAALFRSEPSYKPPVYSSVIDPETGEVDGNRHFPGNNRPQRDDSQPHDDRVGNTVNPGNGNSGNSASGNPTPGNNAPGNAPGKNAGRRRGGRNQGPRKPGKDQAARTGGSGSNGAGNGSAPANAAAADSNASAPAQPGKRRRRFRRRRGGGAGAGEGAGNQAPPAAPGPAKDD